MQNKISLEIFKNNKFMFALKYAFFFLLFFVLGKGSIGGLIYPFAFGMLFALVWCNQNVLILSPLYIIATYLGTFDLGMLGTSIISAIILLVCYGIHYRYKEPIKIWLLGIYALISQSFYIFYQIYIHNEIIAPIICVVVSILFMYACIQIFQAILIRGFVYKLTTDEIICSAIVLAAFASGLVSFNIYGFEIIKLIAAFLILLTAYTYNVSTSLFTAIIMGIGSFMASSNPNYLAAFAIWGVAVSIFKVKNKIFPCLAILLCEGALGFFLDLYGTFGIVEYLPVFLAIIGFIIIPGNLIEEISGFFNSSKDRFAMRNIVNRNRDMISRKLNDLSEIFAEMNRVFRTMLKRGLSEQQAKDMLLSELKEKVCEGCLERSKCHRTFCEDTNKVFTDLITAAFERGKATLIDVPPYLTTRCTRVNPLITTVNQLTKQYQQYSGYMNNIDSSRVLIAEQLFGVSKVMRSLASEVDKDVSFDTHRENKIIDELTYSNIICSDAVVYEQSLDIECATLVIRKEDVGKSSIENIVSKICDNRMVVSSEDASPRSGWSIVNLKTAPKYDIVFGTAACTKATSKISGDSYSLIRIDNDKFMMALCDGMGSGKKAEKASNFAIGLVENFYKAGFDNEIILSSVNNLLTLGNDEVFSALDLCVIDLRKGIADLIKLGAPCGFLKHKHEVEIIESGALPLGILQEMQPSLKKIVLSNSDMIILCTDGITDSFASDFEMADFVNNIEASNPQKIAEEILDKAIVNCNGSAVDDMTIIVAKIFQL